MHGNTDGNRQPDVTGCNRRSRTPASKLIGAFGLVRRCFPWLWQVLDSNKSGGFLARGDTAQTAAD